MSKLQDNGRDLPHTVKPGQVSGTLKTLQLIGSALNKCIFLEFKISNVQRESSFPLDRCWHPSPMDSLLLRFTLKSCEFVFFCHTTGGEDNIEIFDVGNVHRMSENNNTVAQRNFGKGSFAINVKCQTTGGGVGAVVNLSFDIFKV